MQREEGFYKPLNVVQEGLYRSGVLIMLVGLNIRFDITLFSLSMGKHGLGNCKDHCEGFMAFQSFIGGMLFE